jgi:alcohol dehydrogenase (cytochrome c)
MVRSLLCFAALASLSFGTSTVAAQQSRSYSPVTDARLESPEARNWLMFLREYNSWSYSPLREITTRNVANLVPVWTMSTGTAEGHQSPPIVNDGVMFITTPFNQVIAIDAATGDLLWRYRHTMPADIRMGHPTNRGVALYGDKVYTATSDARVVALDAKTGAVVWNKAVENYNNGYYMTIAPLAARGKIMVGVSGGERGIRGFVVALDANTGEQVWKSYTIPAPGEPGNDTWPGDSWKTGGAPVWVTGSYDPKLGLTFWGTGNPGPWTGDTRPGDNLYTNSVVAFDVETGALKGYHQYHWND